MYNLLDRVRGLPLFAVLATAAANYPAIPSDKTTPVQQRLAISGANCKLLPVSSTKSMSRDLSSS